MFEEFFRTFLTAVSPALQNLLVSVSVALIGLASAYVHKLYQTQKAKLSTDQQFFLDIAVNKAVTAVEQMYFSLPSEAKKENAVAIAESFLKQAGITVDLDVIEAAIESAVFQNNFPANLSKG